MPKKVNWYNGLLGYCSLLSPEDVPLYPLINSVFYIMFFSEFFHGVHKDEVGECGFLNEILEANNPKQNAGSKRSKSEAEFCNFIILSKLKVVSAKVQCPQSSYGGLGSVMEHLRIAL